MLLLRPDGVVAYANPAARTGLSIEAGEALPDRVERPEKLRHYLTLASRSSDPLPGSLVMKGEDGKHWRCDGCALDPAGDAEPRLFLHLRPGPQVDARFPALNAQMNKLNAEIRRRQTLEEEREILLRSEQEARKEAEEANRLKDEFLASVSHELRTPLHAMTGWLNLLRSQSSPEMLTKTLDVLDRNLEVQAQIIEDLVDVSRIIAGQMRIELERVNLTDVVRRAIETARPAAESKDLSLELIADPQGCVVHADRERMLQVVWNLLSNATKFTPKGGRVQVVVRRIDSHAEIVVSDTGEGIPPEVLPYVFDRFRQADGSPGRRHGGLGLGLAIVRQLVELHGGVVVADSDGPGKGATFTVNLPMPIFERGPAVAPTPHAEEPGDPAPLLDGCWVLLVEDHDDSRELLERILAGRGARVSSVVGAEEAFTAFAEGDIDVVVSDIELPGEDGFTLMRKLRALEEDSERESVPAIAVSAHTIGEARVHALRAGYQTFLVKPIDPDELVEVVRSLCEMQQQQQT